MKIGENIKELRKTHGITQEQLAENLGISFQAVSKWENNIAFPDITLIPALAEFFGVTIDYLFACSNNISKDEPVYEVKVIQPETFTDSSKALADLLKTRKTVIVNFDETNRNVRRRLLDFMSGIACMEEFQMNQVSESSKTFMITPIIFKNPYAPSCL